MFTATNNKTYNMVELQTEDIQELLEFIEEEGADKLKTALDEFIDEEGDIYIFNMRYSRSRLLEDADPVAYECCLADFIDAEIYEDVKNRIEEMRDGDREDFYGVSITKED